MSLNYQYIVELARRHAPPPARLLDFGCGAADVAVCAQQAGFEAHGVDSFLGVGDSADNFGIARRRLGERAARIVPGEPLPFAAGWFDIVVSNQVFEHVDDLPTAVAEIARVTRSGGALLALMPTSEILWEAHLRMPLVHRFANGSAAQRRAMKAFRQCGFGTDPATPAEAWVEGAVASLRDIIHHRSIADYLAAFSPAFSLREAAEADWARHRLAYHRRLRHLAPLFGSRLLDAPLRTAVRRAAGVVLVLERTGVQAQELPS